MNHMQGLPNDSSMLHLVSEVCTKMREKRGGFRNLIIYSNTQIYHIFEYKKKRIILHNKVISFFLLIFAADKESRPSVVFHKSSTVSLETKAMGIRVQRL